MDLLDNAARCPQAHRRYSHNLRVIGSGYSRLPPARGGETFSTNPTHHCHASLDDLTRRVATFQDRINQEPCVVADRLWVKDRLDSEEEKLRFSN